MNSLRPLLKGRWIRRSLTGWLTLLASSVVAQESTYVAPPSGPYQSSSVVIEESGAADAAERQIYRFPPGNMLSPGVAAKSYQPAQRQPELEPRDFPPPPAAGLNPQASAQQQARPEQWRYPDYTAAPYPYSGAQNWYGYQGGVWQQPAPGYGYYPYPGQQQYPQRYAPFDNMPPPWSAMPKNPFFSD